MGPAHIENPDTLREQVEKQVRVERESKPWLRDAREAASARERLAKLETLEARLAVLADGEGRLRALEELPLLVEEYLKDLPYLVDHMPIIREYETVGAERTPDNPLGIYALTPDKIRPLPEEEVAGRRLAAEAARGARFRELYAMLGLREAIHADGTLEITVGATGEATKGVMPCGEPD